VWECCKDERQSQWANGKIWPSADGKPLNRSSPNLKHVISTTTKIRGQSAQGFCPPPYRRNIHPKPSLFSQCFRKSTDALVRPIFTFNMSYEVVLCKVVLFLGGGWEKLISKFDWFIRKKNQKIYNGVYGDRVVIFDSRVGFRGLPV